MLKKLRIKFVALNMATVAVVLAVMILPIITSMSRDIFLPWCSSWCSPPSA